MDRGMPELGTLLISIFLGQVLVDNVSKTIAYILFIPILLVIYISCKFIEAKERQR